MSQSPQVWIGTSWKMNKQLVQALHYAEQLMHADTDQDARIQRFVIPPFTAVREVKAALVHTGIKVGAQNMHWDDDGAWTGEISAPMLTDCQLDLVELGHSERRAHFGETDETVGLKVDAALRHELIPLICVGETRDERDAGRADDVLVKQVKGALHSAKNSKTNTTPVLFAYEPVWAIGDGGTPASADYADQKQKLIAEVAKDLLGVSIPCLYGGSVNAGNCQELIQCDHIDGLFIGRSAWDAMDYLNILKLCGQCL